VSADSDVPLNANVETAIRLGWRMATVYHQPPSTLPDEEKPDGPLPPHLPGENELGDYERTKTLCAEIQHDVKFLEKELSFTLPSDADLTGFVESGVGGDTAKRTLLKVHRELRRELATLDSHLARGLDLGRMLADTVLLVDPKTPKTLVDEFDHFRLGNAYAWLDDLHGLLPGHASYAVSGSLKQWENWVKVNASIVSENLPEEFTRTLHHQGEMWRRLLCGEKQALDLLSADDYKKAGDRVTKRFLGLTGSYIKSWWYVILIFAAVIGAIACVIVRYAPSGSSTTTALIATAAGSLGVSWKTVGSTLGRVTAKAEGPLWDAEVKEAIVIAATRLPRRPIARTKHGGTSPVRDPAGSGREASAGADRF